MPSQMRFYKICALLGTLIILLDVGFSWLRIQAFESSVTEVFESIVRTQMELDGIDQELIHVNKVLSGSKSESGKVESIEVDGVTYNAYEIERLRTEQANLNLFKREKQLDMVTLNDEKKHVLNEVRILFLISLVFLVVGTLLAAFGYLAWYFRVELFEDRRKKPR